MFPETETAEQITDPQKVVIYSELDSGEGKFTFVAEREGTYDFCFANHEHAAGKKTVDVIMQRDIPPLDLSTASKEGVERLQKETTKVLRVIGMVEFQQSRFMQLHDRHTAGGDRSTQAVSASGLNHDRARQRRPSQRTGALGGSHACRRRAPLVRFGTVHSYSRKLNLRF